VVNIGWLGVQLMLANGGSCFLPIRMALPLIDAGLVFKVDNGPEIDHPAYMVFPRESDSEVLREAVQGLRELAREERRGAGVA
jgi:DNA-binding transcriptional LysR family regulator